MAFTKIDRATHSGPRVPALPTITLSKPKSQGAVQVSINIDVAARAGLYKGDYVALEVGAGEDDGWLRITKATDATDGFRLGNSGAGDKRIKFSSASIIRHIPDFPSAICRHVISGDAILVEIPSRLRAANHLTIAA